jgi:hypothetical protein
MSVSWVPHVGDATNIDDCVGSGPRLPAQSGHRRKVTARTVSNDADLVREDVPVVGILAAKLDEGANVFDRCGIRMKRGQTIRGNRRRKTGPAEGQSNFTILFLGTADPTTAMDSDDER